MTIPNYITIFRFLVVPGIVTALLSGKYEAALAGFLVAGFSDAADGYIARQYNQGSVLGSYLDPIADKLLLVSVFVVLGYLGELPVWLVVLVVSRDILIVGAVVLATIIGHAIAMRPHLVSKANAVFQLALAALVLAEMALDLQLSAMRTVLVGAVALLTVASATAYLLTWIKHMAGYAQNGR
ncbi:MAG: CDP-alcohol phosphatidyltransferase family protein [Phyllobacterium sp.]